MLGFYSCGWMPSLQKTDLFLKLTIDFQFFQQHRFFMLSECDILWILILGMQKVTFCSLTQNGVKVRIYKMILSTLCGNAPGLCQENTLNIIDQSYLGFQICNSGILEAWIMSVVQGKGPLLVSEVPELCTVALPLNGLMISGKLPFQKIMLTPLLGMSRSK